MPVGDIVVVFDLEWTSWPGFYESDWTLPGKFREIIQIGAVRLDARRDYRETAALDLLVRPVRNSVLSDYITDLTGITQTRLDEEAVDFAMALSKFRDFVDGASYIAANGTDWVVIDENCRLHGLPCPPVLADGVNLHPILARAMDTEDIFVESSRLTDRLGLPATGAAHDGLADARAIAAVIRHLRAAGRLA